jgi:hypothetical protein
MMAQSGSAKTGRPMQAMPEMFGLEWTPLTNREAGPPRMLWLKSKRSSD